MTSRLEKTAEAFEDHEDLFDDAVAFAKAFAKMGTSIQEQLTEAIDDPRAAASEVNPNALETAKEILEDLYRRDNGFAVMACIAIDECLEAHDEPEYEEDDGSWQYAARVNGL